jgi:hypothetical protein
VILYSALVSQIVAWLYSGNTRGQASVRVSLAISLSSARKSPFVCGRQQDEPDQLFFFTLLWLLLLLGEDGRPAGGPRNARRKNLKHNSNQ